MKNRTGGGEREKSRNKVETRFGKLDLQVVGACALECWLVFFKKNYNCVCVFRCKVNGAVILLALKRNT